ncbi:hypothetical protein HMPREF1553_01331 [Porphyromonas gingivalis F0568]|nr:hypothetical protein HMPREF1553_01331 [Porphyromonas gingivalis F0568]
MQPVAYGVQYILFGIDSKFAMPTDGAQIVESTDVVKMFVSQQNGIERIDAGKQSLLAKVRAAVDKDSFPCIRDYEKRSTGALVMPVFATTYPTMTADFGDAGAGA